MQGSGMCQQSTERAATRLTRRLYSVLLDWYSCAACKGGAHVSIEPVKSQSAELAVEVIAVFGGRCTSTALASSCKEGQLLMLGASHIRCAHATLVADGQQGHNMRPPDKPLTDKQGCQSDCKETVTIQCRAAFRHKAEAVGNDLCGGRAGTVGVGELALNRGQNRTDVVARTPAVLNDV